MKPGWPKGPYTVQESDGIRFGFRADLDHYFAYAEFGWTKHDPHAIANLFIAAPDLYNALELLVNELGHKDWCAVPQLGSLNGAVCTCPVKHAEEAMAKARGETK